jgi:hypothetical protein
MASPCDVDDNSVVEPVEVPDNLNDCSVIVATGYDMTSVPCVEVMVEEPAVTTKEIMRFAPTPEDVVHVTTLCVPLMTDDDTNAHVYSLGTDAVP